MTPTAEISNPSMPLPAEVRTPNSHRRRLTRKLFVLLSGLSSGVWMFLDGAGAMLCLAVAYLLADLRGVLEPSALIMPKAAVVFGLFFLFSAHILGLHDARIRRSQHTLLLKSVLSVSLAVLLTYFGTLEFFLARIPIRPLALAAMALFALLLLSRAWIWRIGMLNAERLCLLGSRATVREAKDFLLQQNRPVEIYEQDLAELSANGDLFIRFARSQAISEVVCVDEAPDKVTDTLLECLGGGMRVSQYPDYVERNYNCVSLPHLTNRWFLSAHMEAMHPQFLFFKRAVDILVSSLGLCLAGPFLLLAIVIIKLESRGPIFYRQIRTGHLGRPFSILKLRSMQTNAEAGGPQWAKKGDARVTRVGKWLRLTRMDEVPQFINILRGDMSFIGPRPERPEFVEQLAEVIPFYKQRHLLKPGLTGWAQIQADYGGTVDGVRQKLQYDLYYVRYASLVLDLHICVRTLGAMMKGAR